VTRHGLNHAWAAATALRPTGPLMLDVVNGDLIVCFGHYSSLRNRSAAHHDHNNATRQTCRGARQTGSNGSPETNSP
jgi:hypothetical protein